MKNNNHNPEPVTEIPGRIEALTMKKARSYDLMLIVTILLFGMLGIWTGRMMGYTMSPSGAEATSAMLDDLQLPGKLPNAQVQAEDGTIKNLLDIATDKYTILSAYAPWCGPCQEELPMITRQLARKKNYIVLISKQENPEQVREQLNNIGLHNVTFYQDISGDIMSEGKVKALPTTFLITINGRVIDRQVGYSGYRLNRLINRASGALNVHSTYNL